MKGTIMASVPFQILKMMAIKIVVTMVMVVMMFQCVLVSTIRASSHAFVSPLCKRGTCKKLTHSTWTTPSSSSQSSSSLSSSSSEDDEFLYGNILSGDKSIPWVKPELSKIKLIGNDKFPFHSLWFYPKERRNVTKCKRNRNWLLGGISIYERSFCLFSKPRSQYIPT